MVGGVVCRRVHSHAWMSTRVRGSAPPHCSTTPIDPGQGLAPVVNSYTGDTLVLHMTAWNRVQLVM